MIQDQIMKDLLESLKDKPKRLEHILGVRDTAIELGKKYKADINKLEIAALLHDMTKYYSKERTKQIIQDNFVNYQEIFDEFDTPILHSFTAYAVAKEKYKIIDVDILNAILYHTVGKANMSLIEEIIFVSDYIEPNRTYASCVKVRELAKDSLDIAVFTAIDDTIKYHEELKGKISKQAYEARKYYQRLLEVNHG